MHIDPVDISIYTVYVAIIVDTYLYHFISINIHHYHFHASLYVTVFFLQSVCVVLPSHQTDLIVKPHVPSRTAFSELGVDDLPALRSSKLWHFDALRGVTKGLYNGPVAGGYASGYGKVELILAAPGAMLALES